MPFGFSTRRAFPAGRRPGGPGPDHTRARPRGRDHAVGPALPAGAEAPGAEAARDRGGLLESSHRAGQELDHRYPNDAVTPGPTARDPRRRVSGRWASRYPEPGAARAPGTVRTWAVYRP
ncbi:hypothetical protein GCM10009551_019980 [Nocardiopsis tropica]